MAKPKGKCSGPHVASQTAGSWIGDAASRGDALAAALERQSLAFGNAKAEIDNVREFIGSPEHILGSEQTKHGEIAEQVHVGFRRAMDAVHSREPTATFDGVPRTSAVDYVDGGKPIQSKYYNGLRNTLGGVASHAEENNAFATGEGKYHIPRDQFEQLTELRETGTVEGLSPKRIEQLKGQVESLQRETGRPIEELVDSGEASYSEVQQGEVHKAVEGQVRRLKKENEDLKGQARDEHGPSVGGSVEAAVVGMTVGVGVTLAGALWEKYREGKNPFLDGFSTEDWKEVGLNTARGGGTGALAGFSIYWLTNSTKLAAPFAGSLVSGLVGIGTLLQERQRGNIDDEEFCDLSMIAASDAAAVGIAVVAGQTMIPVPVLGAFIGSVAGKIVTSAVKGSLGEAESELVERLLRYEMAAVKRLDDTSRALTIELDAYFGQLDDLARIAFDERVNTELRVAASVRFAEAVDVPSDFIIRSRADLDTFMKE